MAFEFNMFGTPVSITTGYEGMFESEEEKRRRKALEEQANAVVHTTKVDTYGDGSRVETTKREIPAPVETPAPAPLPTVEQPAQPQMSMAEQERQRILSERGVPAGPAAPVAPAPAAQPQPQAAAPAPAPAAQPQMAGPVAPVAPVQLPQPGPGVQVAGPMTMPPPPALGQGLRMPAGPAMNAAPVTTPVQQANQTYMQVQDDIPGLLKFAYDETQPEYLRDRARARAAELNTFERVQNQIKREIPDMSPKRMAAELSSNKPEGSWVKMLLLSYISPQLAGEEAAKLGFGKKWVDSTLEMPDGSIVGVQLEKAANGRILQGAHADGTPLTIDELAQAQAQAGAGKLKPEVSTQDVEKNGMKGRVVTEFRNGRTNTYVESGGKKYAYDGTWKPVSISTAAEKATQQKQINLAWDPVIGAARKGAEYLGEFNAKHGTNFNILGYGQNQEPIIEDANTGQVIKKPGATGVVTATTTPGAVTTGGAAVTRPTGKTPAQIEQEMALGKKQAEANIEATKEVRVAEEKVPAEARGTIRANTVNNQNMADEYHGLMQPIADLIKKSTGSKVGATIDSALGVFGASTPGGEAIAELNQYSGYLMKNVPRFKGSDSDRDVKLYERLAGNFNDPEAPIPYRLSALKGMINLMKKYDKEGKNDWSFSGQPGGEMRIVGRRKKEE